MRPPKPNHTHPGFTRADLTALLASLVVLAGLALTAAGTTRNASDTVVCANNLRQLQRAVLLYAGDHRDELPYNLSISDTTVAVARNSRAWALNLVTWGRDTSNTNVALLRRSSLADYLPDAVHVFHCPSDRYVSPVQRISGWLGRVRSYSMNGFFGRSTLMQPSAEDTGHNLYAGDYRQHLRLSDLQQPHDRFVLLEEHPDSINDGYFINIPTSASWGDLPASFHSGALNLSYADGRVETHRWQLPATRVPIKFSYTSVSVGGSRGTDYRWLMERTTEKLQ
jgi:prepilin-type processing-associated H-X9-DG protein